MNREEKIMGALADFVIRYHRWLLLAGLVLLALAVLAAGNIEVKTQMKDLLPENNPQVRSYQEIEELFSGGTSIMVTVEGGGRAEMIRAAEAFVQEAQSRPELMKDIRSINLKIDRDFVTDWGLLLQEAEDLERTRRLFSRLNLLPLVTALNDSFEETYTGEGAEEELDSAKQEAEAVAFLAQIESFFTLLGEYLQRPDALPLEEQARILTDTFVYGDLYGFNYDESMLVFTIAPSVGIVEFERLTVLMDGMKDIQASIQSRFPQVAIGFTGDIAVQAGEQEAMSFDMAVPSLVALGVILLLFVFSFHQVRAILFILATLVAAIVYNYGFIGLGFGEITMLSSSMAVLLVGLGVDFGIAMVVNFNGFRKEGHAPAQAMRLTFQKAGLGIFLAALTTAVAFFIMAATGSKSFGQFGLMLGTGILFCYLAMTFLLPGLLLWFGSRDVSRARIPKIDYGFLASVARVIARRRKPVIIAAGILTAGLLAAAFLGLSFEYDLMKLEPQQMPAIVQYKKVMDKFEYTPFQSMIVADSIEEARALTEALERQPLVASVSSLSQLLPAAEQQGERLELIRSIRAMGLRYRDLAYNPAEIERLAAELQRLEWNVIEIGDLSVAGLGDGNKIVRKRNAMVHEVLGAEVGRPGREVFQKLIALLESDPRLYAERLALLDARFTREMDRAVSAMAAVDRPMTLADLPESALKEMLAADGKRNLVVIYPKRGVMEDAHSMRAFNDDLARVSPRITGSSQVIVTWMDEAIPASIRAGLYILAAVLLFLLASFRSLRYTLLAATPLVAGMVWMLGLYPLLGLKLNFLNIVVIPLVIGMGIDYGIHFAHRYQIEGDIDRTYSTTGKAVWLSALTTMIGFGSLGAVAKFPSVASMGSILFFGIAACLITAMLVLPALLRPARTREKPTARPQGAHE